MAGAARALDPGLLRLRPERGRRRHPLRHRSRGLQDARARPPRRRRDPPRRARRSPAVPLRRIQRPARPEHACAARCRLARGRERAAHARLRRGRPLRQAPLPPRPPAAERQGDRSHRRSPTSARSSRSPRWIARSPRSSTPCATRRSSAKPTSSSPPTTAISTASTGSSSGSGSPTSPSSQVPLLIRGPGIPAGETSEALVGNVDLAPTIAAIAERQADGRVRRRARCFRWRGSPRAAPTGRSLIESLVRDRSTYYGYPYAAVRSGHFLYVEYETGDEELYNLVKDPDQLESVAGDPEFADKQRALADALKRLRDCRGEGCEVTVEPTGD